MPDINFLYSRTGHFKIVYDTDDKLFKSARVSRLIDEPDFAFYTGKNNIHIDRQLNYIIKLRNKLDLSYSPKLSDINLIKTDIGPMFDVSNNLYKVGLLRNNKLLGLDINTESINGILVKFEIGSRNHTIDLLFRENNHCSITGFKVLYNIYKSNLELAFYYKSNTMDYYRIEYLVGLTIPGLIRGILGLDYVENSLNTFNDILTDLGVDTETYKCNEELLNLLSRDYNVDIEYKDIHTLTDLSIHYHIKYPEPKLKALLNNYNNKVNLLKMVNPGVAYLDLVMLNGKILINAIKTNKEKIDITIPDWVWGLDTSSPYTFLPDCVDEATIRFTRPITNPELFEECTNVSILKLYNLDIRLSGTYRMFSGCSNLQELYFDEVFNLQDSKDTSRMFSWCNEISLDNIHSVNPFKTSTKCVDCYGMFFNCDKIKYDNISDLGWEYSENNLSRHYLFGYS